MVSGAPPHLLASGGLLDVELPDGEETSLPALPLSLDGQRIGLISNPPRAGAHTRSVLSGVGLSETDLDQLERDGLVESDSAEGVSAAE